MSATPEIEVARDTPEEVVADLYRLVDLDFEHGRKHKTENNPNSCDTCRKLRRLIHHHIESQTLTGIGRAVEKTAKLLAKQEAGIKWSVVGYDSEFYWATVLNPQRRNAYRRRATEIVYLLSGNELD
jgi:hypothetical protein